MPITAYAIFLEPNMIERSQMYIEEADKLGLDKVKGVLASKLIAGYWFSPEEISYFTELSIPQVRELMFSLDD